MAVKLEKVHGPPVGNFFKRRVEKTYLFWKKTYPIWKAVGGGGTKSLNQKNRPWVVFKFLGPPWAHVRLGYRSNRSVPALVSAGHVSNRRRVSEVDSTETRLPSRFDYMEVRKLKFPCAPVPFDPAGPYVSPRIHFFLRLQVICCKAIDESVLTSEQYVIWARSCEAFAVVHRMAGWDRLYYDFGIRQPALLVHRGWGCINLYAEPDGLALLCEVRKFCWLILIKLIVFRRRRWSDVVAMNSSITTLTSLTPMLKRYSEIMACCSSCLCLSTYSNCY